MDIEFRVLISEDVLDNFVNYSFNQFKTLVSLLLLKFVNYCLNLDDTVLIALIAN